MNLRMVYSWESNPKGLGVRIGRRILDGPKNRLKGNRRKMNETFILNNNISEIRLLREAFTAFGEANNLSCDVIGDLNLALEEIVSNIIFYGYKDNDDHQIRVGIRLTDEKVILEVIDDAEPFNPLQVPEPDLQRPVEEREIGGLGIYLVRNLLKDHLNYKRENGKNVLVMKKVIRTDE